MVQNESGPLEDGVELNIDFAPDEEPADLPDDYELVELADQLSDPRVSESSSLDGEDGISFDW